MCSLSRRDEIWLYHTLASRYSPSHYIDGRRSDAIETLEKVSELIWTSKARLSCIDFDISFSHTELKKLKVQKSCVQKKKKRGHSKEKSWKHTHTHDIELFIRIHDRFFLSFIWSGIEIGIGVECLSYIGQGIGFAFTYVIPENVRPFQQEHRTGEKTSTTNEIGDNRPLIGVHWIAFHGFVIFTWGFILAATDKDFLIHNGCSWPVAMFAHRSNQLPLIRAWIVDFSHIGIFNIRL